MLEMNPEIRKLWTARLREDNRVQGVGKLDYIDPEDGLRKQCCLGVLCELAAEAGIVEMIVTTGVNNQTLRVYDTEYAVLPEAVIRWAGLSDENPELRPLGPNDKGWSSGGGGGLRMLNCTGANDEELLSFREIADLIDGG